MARLARALLAGIRAGMPILVIGVLMTAAASYMAAPLWAVNILFATVVSCTVVKQASVAWQRWKQEAGPSEGRCVHCKVTSEQGVASPFCMSCGAWTAKPKGQR